MFDFDGPWLAILKHRGWSKKTEGGKHQNARVGDRFVLRMFDFEGPWSMTFKNRGRSKKTEK